MAYNPQNPNGQANMADSSPVAIAIDQSAVPVSGTVTITPSGTQDTNLKQLNGTTIAVNTGNASNGTQRVVLATDQPNLTTPINVTLQAATTGGDSSYHLVSATGTNLTNIKDGQSKITGWFIYNNAAAFRKVIFYNSAASSTPTVGSTTILFSLVIPSLSGANVSFPDGINFSSGIWIATTTGIADSDSTGVTLNDLNINIFYK